MNEYIHIYLKKNWVLALQLLNPLKLVPGVLFITGILHIYPEILHLIMQSEGNCAGFYLMGWN